VDGWIVLGIGLVLCFLGIGSLHYAVLACGFGVGWLLANVFGANVAWTLLAAVGGALLGWVFARLLFGAVSFVLGAVVGAVVGARLYVLLDSGDADWLLAAVVTISMAVASGFLAVRFRERFLLWGTAIGGAGMAISGLSRAVTDLDELSRPSDGPSSVVSTATWVALSIAGVLVQRRLFAERLGLKEKQEATTG
jgi:hypothetical protein